jgi:hypothetical protein
MWGNSDLTVAIMTSGEKTEPVEKMIGWRFFALCVLGGLAPYGLLMACLPLFDHFNCRLSWFTVCDGPPWVVQLVIFFIGGVAINWNRWVFRRRRKGKARA